MIRKSDSALAPAGYSGTPLSKKLGIKPGYRVLLARPPENYPELLHTIPAGVTFTHRASPQVDMAHLFLSRQPDLVKRLGQLRTRLRSDTPVWVSWPKKSSGVHSSITEDTVREAALPLGYVDIKVCAVDSVWSALKLVVRKELR